MAAKNAEALRILNQKVKDREPHKFYLCVVCGYLKEREATLSGYLRRTRPKTGCVHLPAGLKEGAKTIRTRYRVLEERGTSPGGGGVLTGRTHQIRAHFCLPLGNFPGRDGTAKRGKQEERLYQALYSKLRFDFQTDGGLRQYLTYGVHCRDVWFCRNLPRRGSNARRVLWDKLFFVKVDVTSCVST